MCKRAFLAALTVAVTGAMVFGGTALAGDPRLETTVQAKLTGSEVLPTEPGDPDGAGDATLHLYPVKNKICYNISASNLSEPTEAHLHMGKAGEEGSVKLKLRTPPQNGDSVRECRRGLSMEFIRNIKRNPENYYIDVHSSEFPDGAVRGQLFKP